MRNFIFIINPISGTRSKKDLQSFIEKETTKRNFPFHIFPSVASGDYSFLLPLISEQNITDVVIAGGDGTISQVTGSLMSTGVNFSIIPCGSGNGLAYTAGIPKKAEKALEIAFSAKPKKIDGFYVNSQFACMLAGLGFDAKVAHDFAKQPKRGLTTYIKQVIKNFISAKSHQFTIDAGHGSFDIDAYFISVANSNQFGNNFTIAPQASLSDGLLDVVIVTSQNKISLLLETFRQIKGFNKLQKGKGMDMKRGVVYFQAEQLTIKNLSSAPLHIDGDPSETPEVVDLRINKKCLNLIVP